MGRRDIIDLRECTLEVVWKEQRHVREELEVSVESFDELGIVLFFLKYTVYHIYHTEYHAVRVRSTELTRVASSYCGVVPGILVK